MVANIPGLIFVYEATTWYFDGMKYRETDQEEKETVNCGLYKEGEAAQQGLYPWSTCIITHMDMGLDKALRNHWQVDISGQKLKKGNFWREEANIWHAYI